MDRIPGTATDRPPGRKTSIDQNTKNINKSDYNFNCVTSITVSEAVKKELAKWKPADVSWTSFLRVVEESIDVKRFESNMTALLEAEEEMAIERARARYNRSRGNRKAGIKARDLLGEIP